MSRSSGSFDAVGTMVARLLAPRDAVEPSAALPSIALAAFGDDIVPTPGRCMAVRVVVRGRPGGGYAVDLIDSTRLESWMAPFVVSAAEVRVAVVAAFADVLGVEPASLQRSVDVDIAAETWVGGSPAAERTPAHTAFAMSRIFDATHGALAIAWPDRAGAGSCSLGAVVEIASEGDTIVEVLPGGEGGQPHRPGRSAWSGPILPTSLLGSPPPWLVPSSKPRTDSGGGGKRPGGDGLVRRYEIRRSSRAHVALDRTTNPPHGLDRAGPPRPSALWREWDDGRREAMTPWTPIELAPEQTLVVETCGGAGHGFPGYGGIEWDPDAWDG